MGSNLSTLHSANARAMSVVEDARVVERQWEAWPILVDPQTSGGLMISVPEAQVADVVSRLRESGYSDTAVIGSVADGSGVRVRL